MRGAPPQKRAGPRLRPPADPGAELLAALLRPRGLFARLCERVAAAHPDAELTWVFDASTRVLLRLLFVRLAAARGLLDIADAGAHGWRPSVLADALASIDRGTLAPGVASSAGLFGRALHAPALDHAALQALDAEPGALQGVAALPVRVVGSVYEELAGRQLARRDGRLVLTGGAPAREQAGVYYTPHVIIDELIEAALVPTAREHVEAGGDLLALRVCDPAMGAGHFLVAAVRRLADALAAQRGEAGGRGLRRQVAQRCVEGVDLSPLSADLARLCLWLDCSEPGAPLLLPEGRLRAGESLLGVDWERERPGGYDVVLGNPPWGAAPLEARPALRRHYATAAGETERSALFTELALRVCRAGGRVGLVTPNTWLTLTRRAGLRRQILETAQIELIAEHGAGTFAAARSIVPLAVVLRPGPLSGAPATVRYDGVEERVATERWRDAPGAVIALRTTDKTAQLLRRVDACSVPLGEVARVCYGIKTGDNAANLAAAPLSDEHVPALRGSGEVRRHALSWGGAFLRYGPHLPGFRRGAVAVPKIVVQYIRNLSLPQRLVAAVDAEGRYYPLNNFSYITAEGPYDLFFLCALLGSATLNQVFAARFRDYNIKPAYLRQLPVRRIAFTTPPDERATLAEQGASLPDDALLPFVDARLAAQPEQADVVHDLLSALARRIAALRTDSAGAQDADHADALIDRVVSRLYGVDEATFSAAGAVAPSRRSRPGR